MVGKKNDVVTCLKILNLFLTSMHCVVYKINLVALKATKDLACKVISANVDKILNKITIYFTKTLLP